MDGKWIKYIKTHELMNLKNTLPSPPPQKKAKPKNPERFHWTPSKITTYSENWKLKELL